MSKRAGNALSVKGFVLVRLSDERDRVTERSGMKNLRCVGVGQRVVVVTGPIMCKIRNGGPGVGADCGGH